MFIIFYIITAFFQDSYVLPRLLRRSRKDRIASFFLLYSDVSFRPVMSSYVVSCSFICIYAFILSFAFSETVQQANEWLSRCETAEVVNCETLPFSSSVTQTFVSDGWPTTTHIRFVAVAVRPKPMIPTQEKA